MNGAVVVARTHRHIHVVGFIGRSGPVRFHRLQHDISRYLQHGDEECAKTPDRSERLLENNVAERVQSHFQRDDSELALVGAFPSCVRRQEAAIVATCQFALLIGIEKFW